MNPNIDATGGLLTQPSEYALHEAAIKAAEERGDKARKQFPNAPEIITCKICKVDFPNPIFEGSSIVLVTCKECRINMMGSRAKNKAVKRGIVNKRGLERAENAVSEAPAIIADPVQTQADLPPLYLSDYAPNEEE